MIGEEDRVRFYVNDELVSEVHNDFTTIGRNWISDRFRGRTGVSGMTTTDCYLAVGYSGGTTTAGMTSLTLEAPAGSIGRTLVGSVFRPITGSTLYLTTWFYNSGGLGPIQEAGLFTTGYGLDDVTHKPVSAVVGSGVLVSRAVKDVTNHNAGDNLTVEWRITL